jgi:hypothetical protein
LSASCSEAKLQEAGDFSGVPIMRTPVLITAVLLTSTGCAPSASRTLPSPAVPEAPPDTGGTAGPAALRLAPGQFRYDLLHSAALNVEGGADTLQSIITTRAVLVADVTDHGDSSYTVTVTADSLHLETRGPNSSPPPLGPLHLGSLVRARFTRHAITIENQLADSLCAYGQLLSTARDLLTPQLQADGAFVAGADTRDTATTTVCRAGTRIMTHSTRDLTDRRRQLQQLTLRGRTELAGTGVLRNDSVAVSGSLTTQGTVFLQGGLRLPQRVETQSTGKIRVQVGDSATVFHQAATQLLERRPLSDSLRIPPQPSPLLPPN